MDLLEDLSARAKALAARHGLEISEDPAMCLSDPRLETIEQVCHELAHALQLADNAPVIADVLDRGHLGVKLSNEVGKAIQKLPKDHQELHEVRCFAIEEEVFWQLGIGHRWESVSAINAAEVQVDTRKWNRRSMQQEWSRYAYEAQPLAERIAQMVREAPVA